MQKSSLLDIIRTFSKEDMVRFRDFIKSPYHNKNSNVVKLFASIKKFAPGFDSENLSKEETWLTIFPGKSYNYGIMKNLIHDLTKLAESYLSHVNFNSGLGYDRHLIKELISRKSYSAFFGKLEKFEAKNLPGKTGSPEYFYNRVFIDRIKHEYSENRDVFQENKEEVFKNMIHYFLDHFLKFAESVNIEKQRANVNHHYPFISLVMEYLGNNPDLLESSEFLKIRYYTVLCFLNDADEPAFRHLKLSFLEAKKNLSAADKFTAYSSIMGVYEILFRKGVLTYEKEFLNLCIDMIEDNVYSHTNNDFTDIYSFTNVIAICMRNGESEVLKKFIKRNIHRIHPEKRETMQNFALGGISFLEKNYQKTLLCYAKTNFNNFFDSNRDNCHYKISSKLRISFSHYELNHFEEVLTEIDSSLHFINNNELLQPVSLVSYSNFFRILRKITLLKLKYDPVKQQKILGEIKNAARLSYKSWLLDKTEELKRVN